MKKKYTGPILSIIIIVGIGGFQHLFAFCACTTHIKSVFKDTKSKIIDSQINPAKQNIKTHLIPQIGANIEKVKKQTRLIEKLITEEKLRLLKLYEIKYILEKSNRVDNLFISLLGESTRNAIFRSEIEAILQNIETKDDR